MKPVVKFPELRFAEFKDAWKEERIDWFVDRFTDPVNVDSEQDYREIGVRSHGKGIFHKPILKGKELGNKRVFWVHPDAFVVNIVFAWEQAVALTSNREKGFIASHRFPMFIPREKRIDIQFMLRFFLRPKGKHLLGLASPGGAGRNKTLGQSEFAKLKIVAPDLVEQQKIATFLSTVDDKLNRLRCKRELLETYKRGLMQKLFSQEIRFKQDDGTDFPDWEEKRMDCLYDWIGTNNLSREKLTLNTGEIQNIHYGDIHSKFSSHFDQEKERAPYIIDSDFVRTLNSNAYCKAGDLIIADASEDYKDIGKAIEIINVKANSLVAGLHTYIARPKIKLSLGFSGYLFQSEELRKKIQKIAQGISVLGISKTNLNKIEVCIPSTDEQQKIANCLSAFDKKIKAVSQQVTQLETFKKGLLQKMFV